MAVCKWIANIFFRECHLLEWPSVHPRSAMYSHTIRLAHAHTRHMVCDFAVSILLPVAFSWQIDKLDCPDQPPRSVCRRAAISLGVKIMDGNKLRLFIGLIQSAWE